MTAHDPTEFAHTTPVAARPHWAPPQRPLPAPLDDALQYGTCHPALALRALLVVLAALSTGALLVVDRWHHALDLLGPPLLAGVGGTLLWLVLVCAMRAVVARLAPPQRLALLLGVGALVAPMACFPLVAFGWVEWHAPRALALPLLGAGLALPLALWLEARARSRRPADASARLAELQSRIRPHFLFNALNTALALVQVDPARAEAVLEDLAELFRGALAEQGVSVTLADELELARRYLAIEQVRFGERLRLAWELDPAAARARVPPLLLQPLVENAVRHGIEPSADGGVIRVRTRRVRGQVELAIDNTLADAGASTPGHGIALLNVRERLRLMHDLAAQFDARRLDGWYRVRIVLPMDEGAPT
jgi:two-component system sensor histidine kinase AlgZ